MDLVRLGTAVAAPTLALAIEAELECLVTGTATERRCCDGDEGVLLSRLVQANTSVLLM